MDAPKDGRGRVWLDVTTTMHAGGHYDGTTRVERSLIRELPACLGQRLGFCAYDRTFRRFFEVAQPGLPDLGAAHRQARAKRRTRVRSTGRAIEQAVRGVVKVAARQVAASADRIRRRTQFAESAAGDVLLLAGENWGRYDFAILRQLRREAGLRVVAVLQDMIPHVHPQFFENAAFLRRFESYVDFLAGDADLVLAISNSTRNDFLRAAAAADPDKVVFVELGADVIPTGQRVRPPALAALAGRPFVIAVSTIQVRKNFDLLYRLWQKFSIEGRQDHPHLVIVGREGFGTADLMHLIRNDPWIAAKVSVLSDASDAELAWLYDNCSFTLYPSWYEGWGLPLSESLAYGKTFIASDRSSLPEAGQGLGIHLDPYDLLAWGREVLRLTNDADARSAMERRIAIERRLPSWADCARSVVAALDTLADATT